MDKKYLSKITVGGSQYDLKDAEARESIVALQNSVTGAMHFLGTSSSAISDGLEMVDADASDGQAVELTIASVKYRKAAPSDGDEWIQLKSGDVAVYTVGNKEMEFVYNDVTNKWQEYGSTGSVKALAFKDSASGNVACAGSNSDSAVTFSGTSSETVLKSIDAAAVAPSFSEGVFDAGSLPSFSEGAFSAGTLPSFTEGAFSAGTLPSLGSATTSAFATEGVVATVNESNETLTIAAASTSNAVTAQGTFSAGTLPSKAADTWSAGTLPSKAADTFSAGSLPSKGADTFNAGSAATFTTQSVITDLGTATAAGQTFNGSTVSVTVS